MALFALDQNFPEPLVQAAQPYMPEVELVPLRHIDPHLPDMEDWEVLLALHHHERPWDGLITTDNSMLNQARELSVLRQTNLTLVVAHDAGHDPIKATGLLLAHVDYVSARTISSEPQIWHLQARNRPGRDPWDYVERLAEHQNRDANDLWRESRLTSGELRRDPLAG